MSIEMILLVVLGLLLLIPIYMIFGIFYKKSRKNVKKDIHFVYHLIPRRLKMPDYILSPYFNRYPKKSQFWTENYWRWCATVTDPFMKAIAVQILDRTKGRSDAYKAGYILKVAQCIYTYRRDIEAYKENDRWQFPVCTAYIRQGDCEDGSFIGAGLAYLCGLDAVVIYREGHALYGVNVKGFGQRVDFEGKRYLLCETTSILPMGISFTGGKFINAYRPTVPPDDFVEKYTFIDQFDKYKG